MSTFRSKRDTRRSLDPRHNRRLYQDFAMALHQRQCTACGKLGHTVTTCSSRAAHVIRELKSKIRRLPMRKVKGSTLLPRKFGNAKKVASQQYTKHPRAERRKLVRRQRLAARRGKGLLSGFSADPRQSLQKLQEAKYIPKMPKRCPQCLRGGLSVVRKGAGRRVWYVCTAWGCRKWVHPYTSSAFQGSKLSPAMLFMVIHKYTNTDNITPPRVDDLAGDCEGGRDAVKNVVETLRQAEIKAAKRANVRGQVGGDVEIDEHGIRSFHISVGNVAYAKYIPSKLKGQGFKYYLNYVRVIGLRQRGAGKVYLRFLPPRPLPPGSKPPPLSNSELLRSRILHRCLPKSTVLHADGARAYPSVVKAHFRGLRTRAVSHKHMEFVKRVTPARLKSGRSASLTGTQAIDSTWSTLNASIPKELHTKKDHEMNARLEDYVWVWLYRINRRNSDGFVELGKLLC